MSESPVRTFDVLADWCDRLSNLADSQREAFVEPAQQLAIENAITTAIAELTNEQTPRPVREVSSRPILARDLLITVDLVKRALETKEKHD